MKEVMFKICLLVHTDKSQCSQEYQKRFRTSNFLKKSKSSRKWTLALTNQTKLISVSN